MTTPQKPPALPGLLPLSIALASVLMAFAPQAQAQSLVELYESARAFDASYQSAKLQYDANVARADQAKAGILPSAGLAAGVSRTGFDNTNPLVDRSFSTQNATLTASQPLYRPANWAAYEQSFRQVELAKAQLDASEQDLIVRSSQAYFDVLAAQDTLTFVRAQKEAVAEQLASAKRNFEVGTSTITDTREAQARFDLVTAQEIAAENDVPVVETSGVEEVKTIIHEFGIEVLNTHQWHIQKYPLRCSDVFDELKTHVASLHGMIEHGDAFGVTRDQVRAAQRPATGPEGARETALRRCFETAPKDSTRPKFVEQCVKEVAGQK